MEAMTHHLQRAMRYRALALLFAPPDARGATELRELARDVGEDALLALTEAYGPAASGDYHRAVGPTGIVRDSESDYEVNPLGGKGPLLADVAGFYLAFGYQDETLVGMSPDHASMEFGFMAWLAFRAAYALHVGDAEAEATCVAASESFAREHVARWTPTLFARLQERAAGTWFERAAGYAAVALQGMEPGRVAAPVEDRRRVALPMLDDSDACGIGADTVH